MNSATQSTHTILHVVNQSGGGTMRYIESLIHSPASAYRHFVWYAGRNQHILYDVETPYYYAFSAQLSTLQQRQIVFSILHNSGIKQLGLHLHSLFGAALNIIEQWADANLPLTVTLHDHHFLSETPFIDGKIVTDKAHIQRVQSALKQAEILLPSTYLLRQAQPFFPAGQLHVIAHGTEPPMAALDSATQTFIDDLKQRANWQNSAFTVAAIGAIGKEKGLNFMKQWLTARGNNPNEQFVCLGYTADAPADQNRPQAQAQQIIHGFYHHAEIPALLRAYSADIVVFFPGIPESFCYALSDINACVPVFAPDTGALGERVPHEQLGTLYPPNITPLQFNQRLEAAAQFPLSTPTQPHSITSMTVNTEHYYRQHEPQDILELTLSPDELSELLADQLHGDNLKWELSSLVRQHSFLTQNINSLKTEQQQQQQHIQTLKSENHQQYQRINELSTELIATQQSLSWKITKPIRAIRRLFK